MARAAEKHIPIRMCVICKERLPKSALSRFVSREGAFALADPRQVLPGRGSYCCLSPSCRSRFEAKGARKCKGV